MLTIMITSIGAIKAHITPLLVDNQQLHVLSGGKIITIECTERN